MDREVEIQFWIFIFFFLGQLTIVIGVSLQSEPSGVLPYSESLNSVESEKLLVGIPNVEEVSAMCSNVGGIHASIKFSRPFSGRVYSLGYDDVHSCVYFNGFYARRILFSIPIDKCGTRLTKNTRDVVDMLENRVYVQMDKYALTAFDRKYAFVCELTTDTSEDTTPIKPLPPIPIPPATIREIRRRPVSSKFTPSERGSASAEVERVTSLTPIIPQNAPRGITPMMPALLFYGNRQWRVPAENIRKSPQNGENKIVHPTVIVPIEDRTGELIEPNDETIGITDNSEGIYWKQISSVPDADLLYPGGLKFATNQPVVESSNAWSAPMGGDEYKPLNSNEKQLYEIVTTTTTTEMDEPATPQNQYANQHKLPQNASAGNGNGMRTIIAGSNENDKNLDSNGIEKTIYLEIKRGSSTNTSPTKSNRVDGSVRIGEPITLVVHAKGSSKDPKKYNIFVHSCYSSGSSDLTRIQLIDSVGCAVHPQVISGMKRERIISQNQTNDEVIYYFSMRAFKFPSGDDVHFFCSVDISTDYEFPALCPTANIGARLARRWISRDEDAMSHRTIRSLNISNMTFVASDFDDIGQFERVKGDFDTFDKSTFPSVIIFVGIISSMVTLFTIVAIITSVIKMYKTRQ